MAKKQILQQAGDGTAVPTGMVGEVKSGRTADTSLSSGTYNALVDLTLSAGLWLVTAFAVANRNAVTLSDGTVAFDVSKSGGTFSTSHGGYTCMVSAFSTYTGPDYVNLFVSFVVRSNGTDLIFPDRTEASSQVLRSAIYGGGFSSGNTKCVHSSLQAVRLA
jgi:hypothetical protein